MDLTDGAPQDAASSSGATPARKLLPRQRLKPPSTRVGEGKKSYAISVALRNDAELWSDGSLGGDKAGKAGKAPGKTGKEPVSLDLSRAPQPFIDDKARKAHLELVAYGREQERLRELELGTGGSKRTDG